MEIKGNAKERSMCVQRLSWKLSPSKASQKEVAVGSKVVIKEGNRPGSLGPWKSSGQACLGDEQASPLLTSFCQMVGLES